MHDPRFDQLAHVLVNYSAGVRPGDLVSVSAPPIAMPLIRALYTQILHAGGNPVWTANDESLTEILLQHASEDQLRFLSPLDLQRVDAIDVHIGIWAEENTRAFSRFDPARSAAREATRKPVLKRFMERAALAQQGKPGGLRWTGTAYPTVASAQDAEMSLNQYADFLFKAAMLDKPDPADAWRALGRQQRKLIDFLADKSELRFHVPPHNNHDGTDLRVNTDPAKAVWINCDGHENFPDGEVFTGPQDVNGHVNYTFPAVYDGREVTGVRLAFKDGRVTDASATKNQDFLIKMLDQDRGARNLGEIAIGTNYGINEFTKNTLFDEKIGGTFHAAVGAGYPESGSHNQSGLHWDMVCDLRPINNLPGGTIAADDEVFHKDGRFLAHGFPGNT